MNKETIPWDHPLSINFHLTNIVLSLSAILISRSKFLVNLIGILSSGKGIFLAMITQMYILPNAESINEYFKSIKDSSVVTFIMTYLLQVSKRLMGHTEYNTLVNEIEHIYHVDSTYKYYPSVEPLYDKNGNIKSGHSAEDGRFSYGNAVNKVKEFMKKLPHGDPLRAKCTQCVLILHEMSAKNFTNSIKIDTKLLKKILTSEEYQQLMREIMEGA